MTSAVSPVFNRMLSAAQIERQAIDSLKMWFPTYLRELERQLDVEVATFEPPSNYSERNSFDAEAAERLPKIVVIAPGINGAPRKTGDGSYEVTWRLGIGIAAGAETEELANMLVKGYAAAARGIMLQNSGMGDLGGIDIRWTEESYDDLPIPNVTELIKAASIYFDVDMTDVSTRGRGPTTPDLTANDYDYGQVQTVFIDLQQEEV